MGGSAIGLALNSEANVLAVDTSRACVRAARGFAKRLGSSCRFVVADAADALRWAATHEGPVYVLVQFPTPFALGGEATVRERRPFLLSRDVAELVTSAVGADGAVYVALEAVWKSTSESVCKTHTATPSSRCRVDGVEVRSAAKFDFYTGRRSRT